MNILKSLLVIVLSFILFTNVSALSENIVIIKIIERHRHDLNMMIITKPDNSVETVKFENIYFDKPETLSLNTVAIKNELGKWYELGYEIETVIGEHIGRSTIILARK